MFAELVRQVRCDVAAARIGVSGQDAIQEETPQPGDLRRSGAPPDVAQLAYERTDRCSVVATACCSHRTVPRSAAAVVSGTAFVSVQARLQAGACGTGSDAVYPKPWN